MKVSSISATVLFLLCALFILNEALSRNPARMQHSSVAEQVTELSLR